MISNKLQRLLKWGGASIGGLFLISLAAYLYIAYLLPIPASLDLHPRHISTKILDRHGTLLFEVLSTGEGRKTYLRLGEMPERFLQAVLASEDSDFYQHMGVDLGAIGRAIFFNYLEQRVTSGASTITQQLVRNLLGTNRDRTLQEKLVETVYAIRLSHAYSKDEVLEQYLNTVYFGNLSYGAAEAARNYFDKNLADLDLAEIAMLAGLPKAPSSYNPLVYPEKAKKRQLYVLERLVTEGHITQAEADEAAARKLKMASGRTTMQAPHFVNYLLNQLEEKSGADFLRQGISVKTTLDLGLQHEAEQIIDRQLERVRDKNVGSAALLSTTVPDGQVLVWIGSRDFFNDEIDGQVDLITSLRQPGSALKPFLYLLALERGDTLATVIEDLPLKVRTASGIYSPLNYDLDFHGPVRVREALANSFNIPAVRTQQKVGTANFLAFLRRLGMESLDRDPDYYGLALTLGGGEIQLVDLANAYLTLANYGQKKDFTTILSITGPTGESLYQNKKPPTTNTLGIWGRLNAALIISVLSDAEARLKSFGEGNVLELSVPVAVKTGTTRNFRDNWTFGFTPRILTAVWVGNADASPMENISGIDGAGPIWHDFMEYYIRRDAERVGGDAVDFTIPQGLMEKPICAISGLKPTEGCQEQLDEWFVPGTEPRENDYFWQEYSCNGSGNANSITTRYYINYPFPYDTWARERGYLPPDNCLALTPPPTPQSPPTTPAPLLITSPLPGDSFIITYDLPLASQQIPLRVQVAPTVIEALSPDQSAPLTQLLFIIDGQTIATSDLSPSAAPTTVQTLWLPTSGDHNLIVKIMADGREKSATPPLPFSVR